LEIFSTEFLAALGAIIVIDLVLAGDNAIVIALAARNVPKHLQRRAILWGTVGAIGARVAMTLLVVWLLRIPGLLLIGGAMLIWIAYRLLSSNENHDHSKSVPAASGLWSALRTIVVADAVMGIDNVLAVAGAAHGSFLLVMTGLLISIPIVIWGSSLTLRFIERFPAFVYVGGAVLAATAGKMMTDEPMVGNMLAAYEHAAAAIIVATVLAVLAAGLVVNHRKLEARIAARLARFRARPVVAAPAKQSTDRGNPMRKILVPVDGSANALGAVRHVIGEHRQNPVLEVHLLNVQPAFSRHVTQFLARRNIESYHREQSENALRRARELLDRNGVPYTVHADVGRRAETIARMAEQLRCDHIVMSTARKNSLTRMVEASVTNRVLELTKVPLEVIAGDAVSKAERYGIPAAIAGAGALLALAVAD
jgi:YjbE family integral membrane protein